MSGRGVTRSYPDVSQFPGNTKHVVIDLILKDFKVYSGDQIDDEATLTGIVDGQPVGFGQ